eukprot:scaffold7234_cov23-Cyclotella_meneghiniana.AAC.1
MINRHLSNSCNGRHGWMLGVIKCLANYSNRGKEVIWWVLGFCLLGGGRSAPQNGDGNPPIFVTMDRVSGSSCARAQVCDHAIYSTYLTCDVIHTCTCI